ncbi:MAG: hypothetical protein HZB48_03655 [Actinobacteria bacterium]|nr:hypothetical protein [Actinomycetota bacterium]
MNGAGLAVGAAAAVLDPVALTALAAAVLVPLVAVNVVLARRHPRREVALAWGCGGERTSPRMEYNATSYSEPVVRVFRASLQARRAVDVVHPDSAPMIVEHMSFTQETADVVESRLYLPATRALARAGDLARRVQNGSIHRYIGISFAALVLVLVVVAL